MRRAAIWPGSWRRHRGTVSRLRADRHDGGDAAVERRDLRHRSARQGGVEGSGARVFSAAAGHRRDPCSERLRPMDSAVRLAQHGLEIMSEASGGFAVTNTDDFTSGLEADRRRPRSLLPARVLSGGYEGEGLPAARREDSRPPGVEAALPARLHARRPAAAAEEHRTRWWRCPPACCRRPTCRCAWRRSRCPAPARRRGSRSRSKCRCRVEQLRGGRRTPARHAEVRSPRRRREEGEGPIGRRPGRARLTLSPTEPRRASRRTRRRIRSARRSTLAPGRYEFRVSATSAQAGEGRQRLSGRGRARLPVGAGRPRRAERSATRRARACRSRRDRRRWRSAARAS